MSLLVAQWRIDLTLLNHLSGIHRVGTTNKAWRRNGVERNCTLDQVWRRCWRVQSMGKTTCSFTYISQSPGITQRTGKRWIVLFFFGAKSQLQKSWKLLKVCLVLRKWPGAWSGLCVFPPCNTWYWKSCFLFIWLIICLLILNIFKLIGWTEEGGWGNENTCLIWLFRK